MNYDSVHNIWDNSFSNIKRFAKIKHQEEILWTHWIDAETLEIISTPPWKKWRVVSRLSTDILSEFNFLPPCEATKILGLAFNYKSLVGPRKKYDEPLFFIKTPNCLAGYDEQINYPVEDRRMWLEVELAIVVGKKGRHIPVESAYEHIAGFTIANDITTDNKYDRDHHLALSKAQDGFCPLGPWLINGIDTSRLTIKSEVNGVQKQKGSTDDRILNDAQTVSLLSRYMTLEAGDVIVTGTCAGWTSATVGPGDHMLVSIEGLGKLANTTK